MEKSRTKYLKFTLTDKVKYYNGQSVFYQDVDGRLHHYYYFNGQWNHE